MKTVNLEIGGGLIPLSLRTINLDPRHGKGEFCRKAEDVPWPLKNNSVDTIRASHVMEHIAAGQDRIDVMNEAWRVLKTDGTLEIFVPFLENPVGQLWAAIADPTHVSYWCRESFGYFDGTALVNADYGIKPWITLKLETTRVGWEGHWVGRPTKDERSVYERNAERAQYLEAHTTQYIEMHNEEITRSEVVSNHERD